MRISRTARITAVIATLLAIPVMVVGVARATDDRPPLHLVQQRSLPLFEETARLVDPAWETRPHMGNESSGPYDIERDPFGYQRCDAWRDWIRPGWSAATWHDIAVVDDVARAEIIDRVRTLWSRQEGELIVRAEDHHRPLELTGGQFRYSLTFPDSPDPPHVPDGSIEISVSCLPEG